MIHLARRVGGRILAYDQGRLVHCQARPAKPPERVAYEERERRAATRVPRPAQRPAPPREPTPSAEGEVQASVADARAEQEREDEVQQAALLRARDEAERGRQKRAGEVPWHLRALLDGLPRRSGARWSGNWQSRRRPKTGSTLCDEARGGDEHALAVASGRHAREQSSRSSWCSW